jgi:hypothetical protein
MMGMPRPGNLRDGMPFTNPGAGGNRDTYNPSRGTVASQAEYAADTEREAAEGRTGLLAVIARFLGALRRMVPGA